MPFSNLIIRQDAAGCTLPRDILINASPGPTPAPTPTPTPTSRRGRSNAGRFWNTGFAQENRFDIIVADQDEVRRQAGRKLSKEVHCRAYTSCANPPHPAPIYTQQDHTGVKCRLSSPTPNSSKNTHGAVDRGEIYAVSSASACARESYHPSFHAERRLLSAESCEPGSISERQR